MLAPHRWLAAGLILHLAALPLHAQTAAGVPPNPLADIHAERWADAAAEAGRLADPAAGKVVLYLRLSTPGAATAAEIAGFMRDSPDWPAQQMLERRREEALATDPDDASVLAQCAPPPALPAALLRCAGATANAGHPDEANALARLAWIEGIDTAASEAAFQHRWAGAVDADDQWRRFERLAWNDPAAAARQIIRLAPVYHAAAEARLAARRDDPQTEPLIAALPPDRRDDPGLFLDRVRFLRRTGHDDEALALWQRQGLQAQRGAPAHLAAFWAEREALARQLIRDGQPDGAFSIVADAGDLDGGARADADFLAGFIALRLLHRADQATGFFQDLAKSRAAITQGRAHYWLARALAAQGRDPASEYALAAAWPTTFYGQLAFLALGRGEAGLVGTIRALRGPAWTRDTALAFTGHEVLRGAAWLVAWGDPKDARAFLRRMDEIAPVPAERALTAGFALRAGMPDAAVAIARLMGRDGLMLPHTGWPIPYDPPAPPDPAFSLGIMRQESSFDPDASSGSGARGLMQLMPPTAQAVGRQIGQPAVLAALTGDAGQNMRLGTAYLQDLLGDFDGCLPLATAAYNAGPRRVNEWLARNGDPRVGPVDMVDWIELIPFGETRNYVQRVMENVIVYRALLNDPRPLLPNTPWTR